MRADQKRTSGAIKLPARDAIEPGWMTLPSSAQLRRIKDWRGTCRRRAAKRRRPLERRIFHALIRQRAFRPIEPFDALIATRHRQGGLKKRARVVVALGPNDREMERWRGQFAFREQHATH